MVYVMSDLHGHYKIYEKVKAMLKPEDKVYFLGDAGDRGPDSWKCIKAIYEDSQFFYIKGNHEDMLVKACEDYLEYDDWDYHSYSLCRMNGGEDTMMSWERDSDREMWLKRLRDLPTWDTYEVGDKCYVLCHAGFTPWYKAHTKECFVPTDRMLIWDRDHYLEEWVEDEMDSDVIVVHGHTPIHHLSEDLWVEWESGAFWYCDGHKVCIDSGGFFSDEFILLCLDTGEDTVITLD
jgi:predicted phosphodiesterase